MDNKLIELSKPVAEVRKYYPLGIDSPAGVFFQPMDGLSAVNFGDFLYSKEYVSALLAELEAKDKRIAELECANKSQDDHINQQQDRIDSLEKKNADLGSALGSTEKLLEDRLEKWQELASNQVIKINELQAKLATPVRLPPLMDGELFGKSSATANAHNNAITACSIAIRDAGFKSEATALKCAGDE